MLNMISGRYGSHVKHEKLVTEYLAREAVFGRDTLWTERIHMELNLTRFYVIYIYIFQRDTQCSCTDCLLILRCQLYMFRTVTVHPQELLFRCCMCRLWYVVRDALSDTSSWYNVMFLRVSFILNRVHIGYIDWHSGE